MRDNAQLALLACVAAGAFATAAAQQKYPAPGAGAACDRACLNTLVDSYLAALVAHDPSRVPIAASAKFVENVTAMKPVQGERWQDSRDRGDGLPRRLSIADRLGEIGA